MSQDRLPQMIISIMLLADFDVSERCNIRPRSFDLIVKRGDILVIIKVASHIDNVSADIAWDLNLIAQHLGATPLIVGERARMRILSEESSTYGTDSLQSARRRSTTTLWRRFRRWSTHRPAASM